MMHQIYLGWSYLYSLVFLTNASKIKNFQNVVKALACIFVSSVPYSNHNYSTSTKMFFQLLIYNGVNIIPQFFLFDIFLFHYNIKPYRRHNGVILWYFVYIHIICLISDSSEIIIHWKEKLLSYYLVSSSILLTGVTITIYDPLELSSSKYSLFNTSLCHIS